MKNILISGHKLYTPNEIFSPGAVLIEKTRIIAVGERDRLLQLDPSANQVDVGHGQIIPGLIDLHIHGLMGNDVVGESLSDVCKLLPKFGVTSFLPTTYPVQPETFLENLEIMAQIIQSPPVGARPIGIHLEGPYLSPQKPGMCNPDLCYPLTLDSLEEFLSASRRTIKMLTLAPEEGNSLGLIPELIKEKIIPSVGHSNADFETVRKAVKLGLNHATHTFNAMSGLHHREPGVVGAVLVFSQIVAQMIADGNHLHPAVMDILIKAKGIDNVCLISDAQPFAAMQDGHYHWGQYEMIIRDGKSHLPDGTIAGSVMLMNEMLRILVDHVNIPLQDAIKMGTSVPARVLGIKKGNLEVGYDADLTVFNDAYQVVLTMVEGKIVYRSDEMKFCLD